MLKDRLNMREWLKFFLNFFWRFHRRLVLKNSKIKGIHAGETCLVFGNGASLKYYDFSNIPNLPSISTAYAFADMRMHKINKKYWVIPDSYVLYPLIFNRSKLKRNYLLPILRKIALNTPETTLVTSITHFYSFFPKVKNLIYFHHFGKKNDKTNDLAGDFSVCDGSLDIMLGLAKYLGFSKVILLGCDYLGSPKLEGHFYGDSLPVYGPDDPDYVSRIERVAHGLDILVILKEGSSCKSFKSATFKECFGASECYQSNAEIINQELLVLMRDAKAHNQLYM